MLESNNLFLDLLNNKRKERNTCLISLLEGRIDGEVVTDLQPAQEWCFDSGQTWNQCYSARYRADGKGPVIAPLIRQFVEDVAATVEFQKKAPGESVGVVVKSDASDWRALEDGLLDLARSRDMPDLELIRAFASILNSALEKGQRLVLFCEVEDHPLLETLGLDERAVSLLLETLPERFTLLLAGVKDPLGPKIPDERIIRVKIDSDYFDKSPPEDRSQPLASDTARGNDTLNIQAEINALADAIAARDLEPPLVLGILGGWGAGKSFVLHLLEERLLAIRRKNILDAQVRANYPYVGHFYLVKFDAWTYAKSDLWSSLMQEVLLALNDQIAYEQLSVVEPKNPEALEWTKSVETILGEAEAFDIESVKKVIATLVEVNSTDFDESLSPEMMTQKYLEVKSELFNEMFSTLLKGEDEFSPDVLEMLTRDDADAREILERLDNDILWGRLQGLNARLQDKLADEEKSLREAKLELAKSEAELAEEVDLNLRQEHWDSFAKGLAGALGKSFRTSVEKAQKKANVDKDIPFQEAIESVGLVRMAWDGGSIRTVAVFLSVVLVGGAVALVAEQTVVWWIGASGGVIGGVVESWSRANRWIKAQIEAFNAFDLQLKSKQQERREAQIKKKQAAGDHQERVQNVAELESKVESFRRKIGLTAGHPTLLEFIANRLEEGGYVERLGLLHQVQQDIRQLTDGLFSSALCVKGGIVGRRTDIKNVLFPRGSPRVVLFIDDLDRCPPARVVEVLEAVQLLVKTQLFVVVMAMDVRYITKALEKAYEGVLDRRGAPSGLDYIEKIVQIPYRTRPISAEAMPGYLRSQMQLKADEVEDYAPEGELPSGDLVSVISAPGEGIVHIDETVPQKILEFDEAELELIQETALAVIIGPRATKRLVNVMKLIKIIWYRTGRDDQSLDIKKAVIFFLSLSARYAEIMRRVLLEMEQIVARPGSRGFSQKMPILLARIAKDWGDIEGRKTEWDFLTSASKNAALMPPDMTLKDLSGYNIELIRSFSFVGEVDLPPDPATHKLSIQLQEPVRISQDKP